MTLPFRTLRAPYRAVALAALVAVIVCACAVAVFAYGLSPADAVDAAPAVFEIDPGQGFRSVVAALAAQHLIRSAAAFEAFAVLDGRADAIKPGLYKLDPAMSGSAILGTITGTSAAEATVTVPEGSNIFQIDAILSGALVIKPGALVTLQDSGKDGDLEGTLFPDTYRFYTDSSVQAVVDAMQAAFQAKAGPVFAAAGVGSSSILPAPGSAAYKDVILASILEKEVPSETDREIVAGIIVKRIRAGMPLDVDATVCYAKLLLAGGASTTCPSLSPLDFKIKSAYNTYLYEGLPPGPIGNPGISAITAALHPQSSPYWYYLSDPATGETIFAKTLDEQTANRVKYLESN